MKCVIYVVFLMSQRYVTLSVYSCCGPFHRDGKTKMFSFNRSFVYTRPLVHTRPVIQLHDNICNSSWSLNSAWNYIKCFILNMSLVKTAMVITQHIYFKRFYWGVIYNKSGCIAVHKVCILVEYLTSDDNVNIHTCCCCVVLWCVDV